MKFALTATIEWVIVHRSGKMMKRSTSATYLSNMLRMLVLLSMAIPVMCMAQKGKRKAHDPHETVLRDSLILNAEVAVTVGDLDSAMSKYSKALWMWPDLQTKYAMAQLCALRNDSAGYCKYLPTYDAYTNEKTKYDQHCWRQDSVPFSDSGFSEKDFGGMTNVSRKWFRATNKTVHTFYNSEGNRKIVLTTTPTDTVFSECEIMASYPGGESELFKNLGTNVRYPQLAQDAGIQGVVYLSFTVKRNGSLADIEIIRGVHHSIDAESIRVVANMPKWNPARHNDRAVPISFNLPIRYTLR